MVKINGWLLSFLDKSHVKSTSIFTGRIRNNVPYMKRPSYLHRGSEWVSG